MATFSKPRDISAAALSSCYPVPALYSRGTECLLGTGGYHAVSILYPWASTQQWPTWESRPGGGINQLPPSLGGLLPAHHAAAPGQALPGSLPVRAGWNSQRWELCSLKSLQRGYISASKFDMVAPQDNTEGGDFKLSFCGQKKVWGKLDFWPTFRKRSSFCNLQPCQCRKDISRYSQELFFIWLLIARIDLKFFVPEI